MIGEPQYGLRYGNGTSIDYGTDQASAQNDAILSRRAATAPAAAADPAIAKGAQAEVTKTPGLTLQQRAAGAANVAADGFGAQSAIYDKLARELQQNEDTTVFTSTEKAKTKTLGHAPNMADPIDRNGSILTAIQELADIADRIEARLAAFKGGRRGRK